MPVGNPAGYKPQEKIRHNKVKHQYYCIAVKLPKQVFSHSIEQILSSHNQCSLHYLIKLKASNLKEDTHLPGPRTAAAFLKIEWQ